LPTFQAGVTAFGGDNATHEWLQAGAEQGEVQNRVLTPKPEEPTAVQGSLPEVRLPGVHRQATHLKDEWQIQVGVFACNQQ